MYTFSPQSLSEILNTHLKRRYSWLYLRTSPENTEYVENTGENVEYRKYVFPEYVNTVITSIKYSFGPSKVKFKLYLKKVSLASWWSSQNFKSSLFGVWVSACKTARKNNLILI